MQNIDIHLKPSWQFIFFILLTLICNVGIIFYLTISFWIKVLLLCVVLGYGVRVLWDRGYLKGLNSIRNLYYKDDSWELHSQSGVATATLCGESTMTTFISVLRFQDVITKKKYSCVIFRDSLESGLYRRLLVQLLMVKRE